MPNSKISEAFVEYLQGMVTELRAELALYEAGTAQAGRRAGGEWVDVTGLRIEQIKREIGSLASAIARHREHWK